MFKIYLKLKIDDCFIFLICIKFLFNNVSILVINKEYNLVFV